MKCLEEFCSEEEHKNSTGDEILKASELLWKYSLKVCILSRVYSDNPEVQIIHCFIHKKTPTCKYFSAVMNFAVSHIIKIDSNKFKPPHKFLCLAFYEEIREEHHVFVVQTCLSALVTKEFCQELENIFANDSTLQI